MNKAGGNMYDWVTHTHNHLGGECPHDCEYCSTKDLQKHYPSLPYKGEPYLREKQLLDNYGEGKTIFEDNCSDLFAEEIPKEWIERILAHDCEYPENTYVYQTKNPGRVRKFAFQMPPQVMLGCTIETNRKNDLANAPPRRHRALMMSRFEFALNTFITIEPIMAFDLDEFAEMLILANPDFVNIGADSKNHGLPEPTMAEVMELVKRLQDAGIEVRNKRNLERLA